MADDDKVDEQGGVSLRTVGVWAILGVIVLVFGLQFGLPSDSFNQGPKPVARVHGVPIQDEDLLYQSQAMTVFAMQGRVPEERFAELMGLKEETLDAVVERIVLAHMAEEMGLAATQTETEDLILDGHIIVLGDTHHWVALMGRDKFDYNNFKNNLLNLLAISETRYLEVQRQELLARTTRDLIAASVTVPESELRAQYEEKANKVSLRYARFGSASYAELVDPSPEEIDGYVEKNKDDLLTKLETQGARFTKLPAQVRLRFIKVALPAELDEDADEDAKAADAEARKAARAKIDGAVDRIKGGEDFRAVARDVSEDEFTARGGGDYGWVNVAGTGSGLDPQVDETAAELEDGALSGVVEGDTALWLVRVDGHREGDVDEADALRELAEEGVKAERGKALAKQAANEALLAIKEGKAMSELFALPDALGLGGEGIDTLGLPGEEPVAKDDRPAMKVTGLFAKGASMPGLGAMPELSKAAWEADPEAEAIQQVFETTDGYLIAGIEKRETATDEGFAEAREELWREATASKAARVTAKLAKRECLEAKGKGQITADEDQIRRFMTYDSGLAKDEEGNQQMHPYSICDRVGSRGGMLRMGGLLGGAAP